MNSTTSKRSYVEALNTINSKKRDTHEIKELRLKNPYLTAS